MTTRPTGLSVPSPADAGHTGVPAAVERDLHWAPVNGAQS
jgi:hypothetical protein